MERRRTPGYTRESVIALLAVRHLRDEGKLKIDIIESYESAREGDIVYGRCEASKPNGDSASLDWWLNPTERRVLIQRESGREVAVLGFAEADANSIDIEAGYQRSMPFVAVAA